MDINRDYLSIQNSSICLSDSESFDEDHNKSANQSPDTKRISVGMPKITVGQYDSIKDTFTTIEDFGFEDEPESWSSNDWRLDKPPHKPKGDSWLSRAAPVKKKLMIDFSSLRQK